MARNRKSQSAAIRFRPALRAFLLCLLIGGSGVGYVWQKEQLDKLGQRIKMGEAQLHALDYQSKQLGHQLADMRGPQFLESRIRKAGLGLAKPQDSQILRLPEPSGEPMRAAPQAQFAARGDRAPLGQ